MKTTFFLNSKVWPALVLRKHIISFGMMFVFIANTPTSAQVIVNKYVAVTSIVFSPPCLEKITIGSYPTYPDNGEFQPGDRVLIIQMKGASIDMSNTSSFGDIVALGNAGNFEFGTILHRSGDDITLTAKLKKSYNGDGTGKVQLVKVATEPNYVSQLTCKQWDNNKGIGGVLVIENATSITLGGDINVDEKGFRGGRVSSMLNGTGPYNVQDYLPNGSSLPGVNFGGEKGEGITDIVPDSNWMRGKAASGGGGGNEMNGGGAGGANYGAGGKGGFEVNSGNDVGGIGGGALSSAIGTADRIFLGGGGGGGHQGDDYYPYPITEDATPGGYGGGIVIINTPTLTSDGWAYRISANGADALFTGWNDPYPLISPNPLLVPNNPAFGDDGAGGGGAGGSILFYVNHFGVSFPVAANGGAGGDNTYTMNTVCHAPGGGAGGGVIGYSSTALSSNSVTAGLSGTISYCGRWGAVWGGNGAVINGISLPQSTTKSFVICEGESVHIGEDAVSGVSYLWDHAGSLDCATCSNPLATPSTSTIYHLTAGGCSFTEIVTVTVIQRPAVTATSSPYPIVGTAPRLAFICKNDPSTFPSFKYGVTGAGTGRTYTLVWNRRPYPASSSSVSTYITTHTIVAATDSVHVTDTFTPPMLYPYDSTEYYVVVQDGSGCPSRSYDITVADITPVITISPTAHYVCATGPQTLTASGGGSTGTYQWYKNGTAIPGATSSTYIGTMPGNYYVTYHDPARSPSCMATSGTCNLFPIPDPVIDDISSTLYLVPDQLGYSPSIQSTYYSSQTWYKVDGSGSIGTSTTVSTASTGEGYYYLVAVDVCGKTHYSNVVRIKGNCPGAPLSFHTGTNYVGSGTYQPFTVHNGETVIISTGATVVMEPCSYILVEPGGILQSTNSTIRSCAIWLGVTVQKGSAGTGEVDFTNVTLSDAMVGISSVNGGKITSTSCTYKNNETHIMVGPYTGVQNSAFSGNNFGNVFDLNACTFQPLPSNSQARMMNLNGVHFGTGTNTISTNNNFNQTIGGNSVVYGLELYNTHTLGVDGNTFEGYLKTAFYGGQDMAGNKTYDIRVSNNTFRQNSSNDTPETGLAFNNVDNAQVGGTGVGNLFSALKNGMTFYYDQSGTSASHVEQNTFQSNSFGLVVAPHQYPVTDQSGINSTTAYPFIIPVEISCNVFKQNKVGIIGSGNIAQQISGNDAGNYFYRPTNINSDWDILWQNNSNMSYYVGTYALPNSVTGQAHTPYSINGVLQSASNVSFPSTGTAACYTGPNDGTTVSVTGLQSVNGNGNGLVIYPNPSQSQFTIDLVNYLPGSSHQITIFDMLGRVVFDQSSATQKQRVNADDWSDGLYFVKVVNSNGHVFTSQLIKSK